VGETIDITLETTGCDLYHVIHTFHFSGGGSGHAESVSVSARAFRETLRYVGQPAHSPAENSATISLGTAPVSHEDAMQLDRLLAYYSTLSRGYCTTVEKISATQTKAGSQVTHAAFVDETCATRGAATEWPVTLWTFVARVTPKPGRQAPPHPPDG
jgi:hypothetical protein